MADERDGMDEAALAAVARHALHDEELVAAYAADGLESEAELAHARALVERCAVCRDLHRDVTAIGAGLRTVGEFTARAPRDFRLTADDARRLGGRVSPQGVLVTLRRMVVGLARPVGASLATLGLVGVLVGSTTFGMGGASTALAPSAAPAAAGASAGSGGQVGGTQPEGPKATGADIAFESLATDDAGRNAAGAGSGTGTVTEGDAGIASWSPQAWLFAGSLAMLAGGLLLLLLSFRLRRHEPPRT